MAVDVKQLRIGSHILVNGKRERVRGLDEDNGLIIRFPAEYVNANEVEPIPITSELLSELGFRKEDGFMRLWSKDDNRHFSYIEFSAIRDKISGDYIQVAQTEARPLSAISTKQNCSLDCITLN